MILFHSFYAWIIFHCKGFPGGSGVKNLPADSGFDPWVRKIPWRRKWKPTAVFLPEKIPRTEEPDWLQSTGSQRVRHNLVLNNRYSVVYMYDIFIHSSVDGHLGCFHVLAIVKVLLWTMGLCTFSSDFVSEYMPRALKLYKQALSFFMLHLSLYSPQICHWCWFSVITLSCIICSLVYQIDWIVISKHFWACFIPCI